MKNFKLDVITLAALGIFAYVACFVVVAIQSTESIADLSSKVLPKTVMLHINTKNQQYICSGVFISPVGHILTCNHCVDDKLFKNASVESYSGYTYAAEVLFKDKVRDLALLKVNDKDTPFDYAKIADSRYLRVGQVVIAIGYPYGLEWTVTHGIISKLHRDLPRAYNRLQTDAFISSGSSGGPLFNRQGDLVGVNSFILLPLPSSAFFVGYGFSVESGQVIEFLTNYKKSIKKYEGVPDGLTSEAR